MSTPGQRFKYFREAIQKSREEMAVIIDRTPQAVGDIERDGSAPRLPHLEKLVREFGLNANWLILGEGKMFLKSELAPESMRDAHWVQKIAEEEQAPYVPGKKTLTEIVQKLQNLLPDERVLLAALKGEIDTLVSEREEATKKSVEYQEKIIKLQEGLIDLRKSF